MSPSLRSRLARLEDRPTADIMSALVHSKQNPPPCNNFYLIGDCETPRCKYSHQYRLTSAQLAEMRRGAKVSRNNVSSAGRRLLRRPSGMLTFARAS